MSDDFVPILEKISGLLRRGTAGEKVTEDDIKVLVSEKQEQGQLREGEAEMVNNVFELDEKEAYDIMTPRPNISALDGEMTLEQAVSYILKESNNSRFPVYRGDIDNIIGVLHIRDVLALFEDSRKRTKKIRDFTDSMRKPYFIPEIRKIDQLFHEMQKKKVHMVIVVDEYGQTAGIITMEDILEEIVGNIEDEYDEEESMISRKPDGSFLVNGLCPLEDASEALGLSLSDEDRERFATTSGFLIGLLDRIPEDGEKPLIRYGGFAFQVEQVEDKVIRLVHVKKEASAE